MATDRSNDGHWQVVVIVLAIVVLTPVLMLLLAVPTMGMMGMGWGVAPMWALAVPLLWLLVVVGIGYLLYRSLAGRGGHGSSDPALEELRLAYARGELSDEEFEMRREKLRTDE